MYFLWQCLVLACCQNDVLVPFQSDQASSSSSSLSALQSLPPSPPSEESDCCLFCALSSYCSISLSVNSPLTPSLPPSLPLGFIWEKGSRFCLAKVADLARALIVCILWIFLKLLQSAAWPDRHMEQVPIPPYVQDFSSRYAEVECCFKTSDMIGLFFFFLLLLPIMSGSGLGKV